MTPNNSGRRLLLLVTVSIGLLVAGTGAAVACDTCADPNQDDDEEYEPYWSNEEFPYNTSENRSFVEIVVDETEEEMAEDLGSENGSQEAAVAATVGDRSVAARASADVDPVGGNASDAGGTVSVSFGATVDG